KRFSPQPIYWVSTLAQEGRWIGGRNGMALHCYGSGVLDARVDVLEQLLLGTADEEVDVGGQHAPSPSRRWRHSGWRGRCPRDWPGRCTRVAHADAKTVLSLDERSASNAARRA